MSTSATHPKPVPCRAIRGPLGCFYCERAIRKGSSYIRWGDQPWHVRCYRITTDETYRPFDIKEGG